MARPLAYLTDVEGRWDKLVDFVVDNPYVSFDDAGRIQVADGATFVFGGDSVDRGTAGRRVVAALVDVKRRHPDRVVLLAGNRDINKLRLTRELQGQPPSRAPSAVSRGELLRWILANTMGAGEAFDCRQRELAALAGVAVDDDAVVESYLEDVAEGGGMLAYLTLAQLAYRHDATLVVHGGVTEQSLGTVPGLASHLRDADAWIVALNRWYGEQVDAYRSAPREASVWQALCAYQSPVAGTRVNQASVVYGRMLDDEQRPILPSVAARAQLQRAGINRLLVGHTPMGDAPTIVCAHDSRFTMVMADNSYSRLERGSRVWSSDDDRLTLQSRVRLDDGTESAVRAVGTDAPLGEHDAATGQIIKGRLDDGRWHLFAHVSDRKVAQLAVDERELAARQLVRS